MPLAEIGEESFETHVVQSDRPVLVDVWGPYCKPCIELMPAVETLAKRYEPRLKVVKLNAGQERGLCRSLKVLAMPTFILFQQGEEVGRLTTTPTAESLEEWVIDLLQA